MDEEFMSLDEVLAELGISESELRAMITRGQLRVFGEAGEEKFRRNAIESLKRAAEPQPTVILPGDEEPLPIIDESSAPAEEPAPFLPEDEEPTEMPVLADEEEDIEASDTVMPTIELTPEEPAYPGVDEEHTDVATQEVSLADEDYLILEEDRAPTSPMERPEQFAPAEAVAEEDRHEGEVLEYEAAAPPHGGVTVLVGLLTVLMLLSLVVFVGASLGTIPPGVRNWLIRTGNSVGLVSDDSVDPVEGTRH